MPRRRRLTHSEIDDVKWRVAELLGESFGLYSEDEIAELEAAFRTDDPGELERLYAKWAQRPSIEHGDPPLPDCLDCRHAMRFGYPPQCVRLRPWTVPLPVDTLASPVRPYVPALCASFSCCPPLARTADG